MLRHLPFKTLWGIVRETDLEAIRRGAQARFQVLVAGDDAADAEQIARLIGGNADSARPPGTAGETHPWLLSVEAATAVPVINRESFNLAVLVSRTADLSSSLGAIRDDQTARGVPVVVIVIGAAGKTAAIVRRGEN